MGFVFSRFVGRLGTGEVGWEFMLTVKGRRGRKVREVFWREFCGLR